MKIVNAIEYRCPLPFQGSYRESLSEVLYLFRNGDTLYNQNNNHRLIKLTNYLKSSEFPYKFLPYDDSDYVKDESYAYAFATNLFKTNVLMLDFDQPRRELVNDAVSTIADCLPVNEIDVVASSRDSETLEPTGYHLYAGLTDRYNVLDFYKIHVPGTCKGFMNSALCKQETVLRISRKFNIEQTDSKRKLTEIKWIQGYSKRGSEWLIYGQEQLIAPLTTVDGAYLNETQPIVTPRLRMRG